MTANRSYSEPFSSVDAAWLRMDTPTNLAMINGVMTFPEALDFDRLRMTFEARLLPFDRFRQRVGEPSRPLGLPRWEFDPEFDIDYHLVRGRLPEPCDHAALQQFASDLMSVPLERDRPLWQVHYVDNYLDGSAMICRLHHCIADGIALMQVLLSLADESPDAPWPEPYEDSRPELSRLARLFLPAVRAARAVDRTLRSAESIVHEGMDTLVHPSRLVEVARSGAAGGVALSKLLLLPPDRRTMFKAKCGIPKQAAWSVALDIEDVKGVGRMMGGTINDVLLSAVTGALRRYMENQGEPVDGVNIRAIVPVNLRPSEDLEQLGNRFGLVFLSLPIGVRDQVRRLVLLRQRMDAIKNSPEAVVALGILNFIGLTPVQIEKIIVAIFGLKGSAVMTNVPGPRKQLYLAGQPLETIMFWVPAPSNLSIGVSIISYAGKIILGVQTDAGIVPDPDQIIQDFQDEFAQMSKWGRPDNGQESRSEPPDLMEASSADIDRQPQLCQALTRSGKACRNRALPGETTCGVHRVKAS
jgi:WS/DGAT/MGAT family acyltransferase